MVRTVTKTYTDDHGSDRWIVARIELRDTDSKGLELSLTADEGYIVSEEAAEEEAINSWVSYFEDDETALGRFAIEYGDRTPRAAAERVTQIDGRFHGLDIHSTDGDRVWVLSSCGCLHDSIAEHFPELRPLIPWHLNGMHAGCEHQRAEKWAERPIDPSKPTNAYGKHFKGQRQDSWNMLVWVRPDEYPGGLLGKACSICGYGYGTAWRFAELPPEIVKLAKGE